MDFEEVVFTLIARSGNAKGLCFQALDAARKGHPDESDALMEKAKEELLAAHHVQTELIQEEASGAKHEMNLLMAHAQDHLMNASLAKDLITELILMYKETAKHD
ncbi:lichenan-specific phosphotransferase enzyme IIA component [Peptococcaceae bacterium CEB3]|nr:lichenan-specific phosphotransferase enzyme IIA component [Peptococcaceae bacterium CEB3]